MKDKDNKLIERPMRRKWVKDSGPAWVIFEPARVAPIGGFFFTALTLCFYIIRQTLGYEADLTRMIFGTVFTFVLSYAATGLFVWFLLIVADKEFPVVEHKHERRGLASQEKKNDDVVIEPMPEDTVIEPITAPNQEP